MQRPGADAEELHVEHVREPRQRDPISQLAGRERPADAVQRQTAADDRVLPDVAEIVVLDETVPVRLRIDRQHQPHERGGEQERQAA